MLQIQKVTTITSDPMQSWSFQLHSHKEMMELTLVLEGEEQIFYNGCAYTAHKGELFIKNEGVLHSESSVLGSSLHLICISFCGVAQPGLPPETLLRPDSSPIWSTGDMFPLLEQLFRYLETMQTKTPADYASLSSELLQLILTLTLRILNGPVLESPDSRDSMHQVIPNICQYLDQNFDQNITLEELGRRFHFSSYYLARRFKQETGHTINQYLIRLRIGEAQRLLLFEELPVKEIAQRCGYPNLQHFYAAFKKHTGHTPVEFRNQYIQMARKF